MPVVCALLTILVVAVANLTWITSPYWGRNNAVPPQPKLVGTVPVASGAKVTTLSPNRIVIPRLKAVAPIVPVTTTSDGELDVPANPRVVGWWSPGAKPGAQVGTAILAGHINYAGVDGTLADIGALKPGDAVYVYGKRIATRAVIRFTVTGVRTYHKTRLPYQQIFDQKSVGRIAIVTCGGPFDASTGNYLDNIVVFAVPATSATA
ncbi:MAG TPA: class F sortase [Jatrophihabitans sp.]|uniref:class F sortase n=1 Tax=Jatrophihabitans sp. TaxID=1932789 RepID=UPI002DFBA4F9|nr:class F sortase [Jatrophihabitans sp.]